MNAATKTPDLRLRLRDVEAELSAERTTLAACNRTLTEARNDLAKLNCSPAQMSRTPQFRAAEQARDEC